MLAVTSRVRGRNGMQPLCTASLRLLTLCKLVRGGPCGCWTLSLKLLGSSQPSTPLMDRQKKYGEPSLNIRVTY